jgi:hypothetical protein
MKKILIGEKLSAMVKKHPYLWWSVFFMAFIWIHYFIANNLLLLSQDLLSGDLSGEKIKPAPQYGFFRIPNDPLVRENKAHDRLASDFAQIYFPLKRENGLMENYISGAYDPWARPSRIAPLIHHLCAQSYCRQKYGPASLIHLYLQLALFYIAFIAAFVILKIARHLPLAILLVNVGLFLTPAGLAWFERGQYSLYVAIGYLFVILGILKNKPIYFLLGGLFAFIKWTSFPTLFVVIAVYMLASRNLKSLRDRILVVGPFPAVIVLLLSFFPAEGFYFVQGLFLQEAFISPMGVSLVKLVPVIYVKLMPVVLLILAIPYIRKYGEDFTEYIPYFGAVGILMLTYPTVAYEYNLSTLFCFIPLMLYWSEYKNTTGWNTARSIMKYSFLVFLFLASNSPFLEQVFRNKFIPFWEYALVSIVFLFVPLMPSFNRSDHLATMQAAP